MDCPACHSPNNDGARFCLKCGALLPAAPPDEADPLIGTIVGGRYRITGLLGEGGMGRVYTGEQQMGTSVRKVAVKTLLAQYAKDPQVLARFMRECGTVSELEHPNTIKVYDYGQTNTGELYIAMEFLSGSSLETALERGALPAERVDKIVGQICGSLQEAHDKGIVHRDLKPANIYLTARAGEEDYVKVLDFGIAKKDEKHSKHEQKLTQQGTVLGTPPYMSPEQFKGHELDARSDIYSLGVMTYEMLTGRLPFDADTPWAWATAHMTAQPYPFESVPMAGSVPPKMKAAVMRALSKDKAQRQPTVREFYEEFTMGAPRPSALGGRPSMSDAPAAGAGGTAMMPSRPGPGGGGQTQIGEPIFANAPPAQRTMIDQGSNPSFPAMQPGAPAYPPAHQVPTGSGQVMGPPPTTQQKKGGVGVIIGIGAVAAIAAVGIAVAVSHKGSSGVDAIDAGITLGASSVTVVGSDSPDTSAAASAGTASSTVKVPVGPSTGHTTTQTPTAQTPPQPSVDPKAAGECKAVMGLAAGNNVGLAVNHFRNCDGPDKAAARSAIDAAAQRSAAKGCSAVGDAKLAASIGASSALNTLRSKNCPGAK